MADVWLHGSPGNSPGRAVRAVRAGCCVANAGVPLFALRGVGGSDS